MSKVICFSPLPLVLPQLMFQSKAHLHNSIINYLNVLEASHVGCVHLLDCRNFYFENQIISKK